MEATHRFFLPLPLDEHSVTTEQVKLVHLVLAAWVRQACAFPDKQTWQVRELQRARRYVGMPSAFCAKQGRGDARRGSDTLRAQLGWTTANPLPHAHIHTLRHAHLKVVVEKMTGTQQRVISPQRDHRVVIVVCILDNEPVRFAFGSEDRGCNVIWILPTGGEG
jgi:hypothetical protein